MMEGWTIALIVVGAVCCLPILLALLHRCILAPILRRLYPGISPLFAYQGVPLLRKEQLTYTAEPIFRLTFGLPKNTRLEADLSVGEFIRVRSGWQCWKARSYSPMRVDVAGEFELCVKRYTGGRVSVNLCDAAIGNEIQVSGPFPPPFFPFLRAGAAERIGLIAFGIGITEFFPLAKLEIASGSSDVRILWANKTPDELFDTVDLQRLQEASAGRFKVIYVFSRQPGPEGTLQGRVTTDMLRTVFGDWLDDAATARFLICGNRRMKADALRMLRTVGFTQKLVKRRLCGCCLKRRLQTACADIPKAAPAL